MFQLERSESRPAWGYKFARCYLNPRLPAFARWWSMARARAATKIYTELFRREGRHWLRKCGAREPTIDTSWLTNCKVSPINHFGGAIWTSWHWHSIPYPDIITPSSLLAAPHRSGAGLTANRKNTAVANFLFYYFVCVWVFFSVTLCRCMCSGSGCEYSLGILPLPSGPIG